MASTRSRDRRLSRRLLILVAGAVVVAGGLIGALYFARSAAPEIFDQNRYEGDGGAVYSVNLPGRAEPATLERLVPPARAFVYLDPATQTTYSTWVWLIPGRGQDTRSDEELAFKYALMAARVTAFADTAASWRHGGVAVGQTRGWYVRDIGPGVVRVAILGERVFVLRAYGPNLNPEAPALIAVLDSLRPADAPPLPSAP